MDLRERAEQAAKEEAEAQERARVQRQLAEIQEFAERSLPLAVARVREILNAKVDFYEPNSADTLNLMVDGVHISWFREPDWERREGLRRGKYWIDSLADFGRASIEQREWQRKAGTQVPEVWEPPAGSSWKPCPL
jgi:hypothetical protein